MLQSARMYGNREQATHEHLGTVGADQTAIASAPRQLCQTQPGQPI